MRRPALALFVVEPTHLRCEKLGLFQAKVKIPTGGSFKQLRHPELVDAGQKFLNSTLRKRTD